MPIVPGQPGIFGVVCEIPRKLQKGGPWSSLLFFAVPAAVPA
jgi:hypothetical protein